MDKTKPLTYNEAIEKNKTEGNKNNLPTGTGYLPTYITGVRDSDNEKTTSGKDIFKSTITDKVNYSTSTSLPSNFERYLTKQNDIQTYYLSELGTNININLINNKGENINYKTILNDSSFINNLTKDKYKQIIDLNGNITSLENTNASSTLPSSSSNSKQTLEEIATANASSHHQELIVKNQLGQRDEIRDSNNNLDNTNETNRNINNNCINPNLNSNPIETNIYYNNGENNNGEKINNPIKLFLPPIKDRRVGQCNDGLYLIKYNSNLYF